MDMGRIVPIKKGLEYMEVFHADKSRKVQSVSWVPTQKLLRLWLEYDGFNGRESSGEHGYCELRPGQNVRLTFMVPGVHRKPRRAVMRFVGYDQNADEPWVFDLRPQAGTQTLSGEWLLHMAVTEAMVSMPVIA